MSRSTKSTEASRTAFRRLVPDDERVTVRPMFGSVAAFANTHMFMGIVADELFVRLPELDRPALLGTSGKHLEAVPGRPMREYVTVPDWQTRHDEVREWAARALDYVVTLPPKKK